MLVPIDNHCLSCALPLHTKTRKCGNCHKSPLLDGACAAFVYGESIKHAILKMKSGDRAIARKLGKLLASYLSLATEGALIVPVPIDRLTLFSRGFNQTSVVLRYAGIAHQHLLLRKMSSSKQTGKTRRQRVSNGNLLFRRRKKIDVRGKTICLFDDVITTGATLKTCAKLLKDAGAARVTAVAIARAE